MQDTRRKLVYFIACTLDGFIARPDGNADFFETTEPYLSELAATFPETFPTHVRAALGITAEGQHFDSVIMGRRTYDPALQLGIASPYAHLRQYVFSRNLPPSADPAVTVLADSPVSLVQTLKAEKTGREIWLCGGGELAGQLLPEIDEVILKLNPVAIGSGIPLFGRAAGLHHFELIGHQPLTGGVMLLHYRVRGDAGVA
ncbi:dihydrofolate reductase family protein [Deinococcus radiopugnans]|uniref:Dihydrofolate reductase n=1 Tax=Deinococcus radiopugnans ATCC 19172 TaxID=585398 RepID=A0A5C4Y766_9DEIO|nr:dihydrofolate reductase family protein [Deinococcus radiopugnans]MBB6014840.1 dihydrofolate reductase [Deinococcus radiopugnans ATCC 19172]TNM71734.1 dihydrofolate reductase [Deinococcus radiopugnans ATCC 19172]